MLPALARLGYGPRAPVALDDFLDADKRAAWAAEKNMTVFSRHSAAHAATEIDVFVDAGLPRNNLSRIELMRLEDKQWAEQFHHTLLQGKAYPTWNANNLRETIPDNTVR